MGFLDSDSDSSADSDDLSSDDSSSKVPEKASPAKAPPVKPRPKRSFLDSESESSSEDINSDDSSILAKKKPTVPAPVSPFKISKTEMGSSEREDDSCKKEADKTATETKSVLDSLNSSDDDDDKYSQINDSSEEKRQKEEQPNAELVEVVLGTDEKDESENQTEAAAGVSRTTSNNFFELASMLKRKSRREERGALNVRFNDPEVTFRLEYLQSADCALNVSDPNKEAEDYDATPWYEEKYEEVPWYEQQDLDEDDALTALCKKVLKAEKDGEQKLQHLERVQATVINFGLKLNQRFLNRFNKSGEPGRPTIPAMGKMQDKLNESDMTLQASLHQASLHSKLESSSSHLNRSAKFELSSSQILIPAVKEGQNESDDEGGSQQSATLPQTDKTREDMGSFRMTVNELEESAYSFADEDDVVAKSTGVIAKEEKKPGSVADSESDSRVDSDFDERVTEYNFSSGTEAYSGYRATSNSALDNTQNDEAKEVERDDIEVEELKDFDSLYGGNLAACLEDFRGNNSESEDFKLELPNGLAENLSGLLSQLTDVLRSEPNVKKVILVLPSNPLSEIALHDGIENVFEAVASLKTLEELCIESPARESGATYPPISSTFITSALQKIVSGFGTQTKHGFELLSIKNLTFVDNVIDLENFTEALCKIQELPSLKKTNIKVEFALPGATLPR